MCGNVQNWRIIVFVKCFSVTLYVEKSLMFRRGYFTYKRLSFDFFLHP
jgi:hypothetical protein